MIIDVQNVSKLYTIWSSPSARLHGPILRQIGQFPFLPLGTRKLCNRLSHESFKNFYALRNVSFTVKRGQCVGIIGQNGSGKSTLLQLIAGTLRPTSGSIAVDGKITARLELGSGFNPEFTGRENVFLNGAVLGLSTGEVRAKFDEITEFADIGEFIDQPTKTYSSGMTVRLAFAVQAILNQDILIVDEALSVGDEAFQRKCFSRINSFRKNGGTILFVSHAAGTVIELCDQAILLDYGELILSGKPKHIVTQYHKLLYAPPEKRAEIAAEIKSHVSNPGATEQPRPVGDDSARPIVVEEAYHSGMVPVSTVEYASQGATIQEPHIVTLDGKKVNSLVRGREYIYEYTAMFHADAFKVRFGMLIKTTSGFELGGAVSHPATGGLERVNQGQVAQVEFRFRCLLAPGVYFLNAGVSGIVGTAEVFLHRLIDPAMFRVQQETDLRVTGIVDFLIQPRIVLDNVE